MEYWILIKCKISFCICRFSRTSKRDASEIGIEFEFGCKRGSRWCGVRLEQRERGIGVVGELFDSLFRTNKSSARQTAFSRKTRHRRGFELDEFVDTRENRQGEITNCCCLSGIARARHIATRTSSQSCQTIISGKSIGNDARRPWRSLDR